MNKQKPYNFPTIHISVQLTLTIMLQLSLNNNHSDMIVNEEDFLVNDRIPNDAETNDTYSDGVVENELW